MRASTFGQQGLCFWIGRQLSYGVWPLTWAPKTCRKHPMHCPTSAKCGWESQHPSSSRPHVIKNELRKWFSSYWARWLYTAAGAGNCFRPMHKPGHRSEHTNVGHTGWRSTVRIGTNNKQRLQSHHHAQQAYHSSFNGGEQLCRENMSSYSGSG